jgi:predicted ester cyclase
MIREVCRRSVKASLGAFMVLFIVSNTHAACSAETQALVEKLLYKGFSGGNMEVIEQVFSADIQFDDPMFPPGLEGIKSLVKKNNDAMSNWQFTIDDMLCDGDKTAVRWTANGIHTGSFMHEQPTGEPVQLKGIVIYEIQDQKIMRDWLMSDNLGFLTQIGVLSHENVDMTK